MENALKQLPPKQRKTIELHYFVGLSYKEIAFHLRISEGAVTSNLQNGRRRLRLYFDQEAV